MQKKRTHCKHGHRRIAENLVSIKARGKFYLTCRLCINARSRNRKTKLRLPAPLSPLPSSLPPFCKHGHPLNGEADIVRVGAKRQCWACTVIRQREMQAARELREIRWLNGPSAEVASIPAWGSSSRVTAWRSHEKRLHGTGNRRVHNPWNSAFESPWQEPECWQEILQQSRPTPAEERWLRARACINERARRWRKRVGRAELNRRDRERYNRAKQAA